MQKKLIKLLSITLLAAPIERKVERKVEYDLTFTFPFDVSSNCRFLVSVPHYPTFHSTSCIQELNGKFYSVNWTIDELMSLLSSNFKIIN